MCESRSSENQSRYSELSLYSNATSGESMLEMDSQNETLSSVFFLLRLKSSSTRRRNCVDSASDSGFDIWSRINRIPRTKWHASIFEAFEVNRDSMCRKNLSASDWKR